MRKRHVILKATFLFLLVASSWASAEDSSAIKASSSPKASRALEINRSLIERFQAEYELLNEKAKAKNSADSIKKMEDLEYKIKALKEDALRLQSAIPEERAFAPTGKTRQPFLSRALSLHEKALDLVSLNMLEEAAGLYEEIILSNSHDEEAYILLGHCRLLSNDYDKAKTAYESAISLKRENAQGIISFYQNLVIQSPYDDEAQTHLGYAYLLLNDLLRAKEAFKDALELNPDNERARAGFIVASQNLASNR